MSERHFVVVGNGPAGDEAARCLRDKDPNARVTLVTRSLGPCFAPHRLPDYIAGKLPVADLYESDYESCRSCGIRLRCGQEVSALDLQNRRLVLEHREVIAFDGLILAVGGKPRIPETLGPYQDLLLTLKTLDDATVWKERLSGAASVLIIGGDLTSIALTRALVHLKKDVHFIVNEDAFWPLRFSEALFREVSHTLDAWGVRVACGMIKGITPVGEEGYEVQLDGRVLRVGIVGAFFGLVPDVRFLMGSGLHLDRGILVDQFLSTGVEGVFAAGDCAQIYHPDIRDYWVSIGYENARTLGRLASLNLLGQQVPAHPAMESLLEVGGVRVNTSWWKDF